MFVNDFFFFFTISSVPENLRIFPVAQNLLVKLNYVLFLKLHIKTISHPVKYAESIYFT